MDPMLPVSADLSLRCLRPDEAESLFNLVDRNRGHLRKWLPWVDSTRSPEDIRVYLDNRYAASLRDLSIVLGIRYREQLAGVIEFHAFDRTNRVTSLGYWLAEACCGKGIMRQSVSCCIDFAFGQQAMNRLYIRCATGNKRSQRLAKSLGFAFEGVQREAEWLYDRYVDLEVYSILAAEWKAGEAARH